MEDGRPTKYESRFNKQVFKLCLLGATDAQIADFFEVAVDTIHEWKKVYRGFSDSIKKGKEKADSEVANKLYTRAIGYKYDEVTFEKEGSKETIEMTTAGDLKKSDTYKKRVVVKEVIPDTTAQIFWLKNRQKEYWRDKQEVALSGDGNYKVTLNLNSPQ